VVVLKPNSLGLNLLPLSTVVMEPSRCLPIGMNLVHEQEHRILAAPVVPDMNVDLNACHHKGIDLSDGPGLVSDTSSRIAVLGAACAAIRVSLRLGPDPDLVSIESSGS
jgi:hypothetical protein